MLRDKHDQARSLAGEERIRGDIKRSRAPSYHRRDARLEFALGTDLENLDLLSEAGSRLLQLRQLFAGPHPGPIDQHGDDVRGRYELAQQREALRVQFARDIEDAG